MKRSEAVKIISDFCKDNPDISSSFDKYRLMKSSMLLYELEKAGILPPRADLPKLGISDNAWEPEDE